MNRRYVVYRAYDADDWLLYVGCTSDVDKRMANHRSRSEWYQHMDTFSVSKPMHEHVAFAVERQAITAEAPAFNVMHNFSRIFSQYEDEGQLTLREAAKFVSVSVSTLRRFILAGDIPSMWVDGHCIVTRNALVEWIKALPTEPVRATA